MGKCTLAIGYLSEYTHTAVTNVSTMLSLVQDVDSASVPEDDKIVDTKKKRMNLIRDASKSASFLEKVRKARWKQSMRKTRLEKRAIAMAAGEDPSSSGDHISDDFQYDYTQHSCELLNGGKARPTVLEATFPSIKDDSSHSDQFVYNGTM